MHILPSFPIAIKYPSSEELQNIDLFLEEAKTMLRIGSYHDYIVNLQGLIYNNDEGGNEIPEVSIKMMVIQNVHRKMNVSNKNNIIDFISLFSILKKVALILEYCSKGDMKSYLIKNRQDFEQSLDNVYHNKRAESHPLTPFHDVALLYRWTYQV